MAMDLVVWIQTRHPHKDLRSSQDVTVQAVQKLSSENPNLDWRNREVFNALRDAAQEIMGYEGVEREPMSPAMEMATKLFGWVQRHLCPEVEDPQGAIHHITTQAWLELISENRNPDWHRETFRTLCYLAKGIMEDDGIWCD